MDSKSKKKGKEPVKNNLELMKLKYNAKLRNSPKSAVSVAVFSVPTTGLAKKNFANDKEKSIRRSTQPEVKSENEKVASTSNAKSNKSPATYLGKMKITQPVEIICKLKNDVRSVERRKPDYLCNNCGAVFDEEDALQKHCEEKVKNYDKYKLLKKVMPSEYDYCVKTYQQLRDANFRCELSTSEVTDENSVREWLKRYEQLHNVHLRSSYFDHSKDKKDATCQMVMFCDGPVEAQVAETPIPKRESRGHPNCRSSILIRVVNVKMESGWSMVRCDIDINHRHNHQTGTPDGPSPSEQVVEQFIKLFDAGYSPTQARAIYRHRMKLTFGDEYPLLAADSSTLPDITWVIRRHGNYLAHQIPFPPSKSSAYACLQAAVYDYRRRVGDCVILQNDSFGEYTVTLVSPLMKRVMISTCGRLNITADAVFVGGYDIINRLNCRLYYLAVDTPAGGFPLGIICTSTASGLPLALSNFRSCIPDVAFRNRGKKGPLLFVVDDQEVAFHALSDAFPHATIVPSAYHFAQRAFKYLWNEQKKITDEQRSAFYSIARQLAYSKSPQEYADAYANVSNANLSLSFPDFKDLIASFHRLNRFWVPYCVENECLGTNPNVIFDAAVRVQQEISMAMPRTLQHSIDHFFSHMTTEFERFFIDQERVIEDMRGQQGPYLRNMFKKYPTLRHDKIDSVYQVRDGRLKKSIQFVDAHIRICTCPTGITSQLCRHQSYLRCALSLEDRNAKVSARVKSEVYYLRTGRREIKSDFFETPSKDAAAAENIAAADKFEDVPVDTLPTVDIADREYFKSDCSVFETRWDHLTYKTKPSGIEFDVYDRRSLRNFEVRPYSKTCVCTLKAKAEEKCRHLEFIEEVLGVVGCTREQLAALEFSASSKARSPIAESSTLSSKKRSAPEDSESPNIKSKKAQTQQCATSAVSHWEESHQQQQQQHHYKVNVTAHSNGEAEFEYIYPGFDDSYYDEPAPAHPTRTYIPVETTYAHAPPTTCPRPFQVNPSLPLLNMANNSVEDTRAKLSAMFNDLNEKCASHPHVRTAVQNMFETYRNITDMNFLLGALHSFGKQNTSGVEIVHL